MSIKPDIQTQNVKCSSMSWY